MKKYFEKLLGEISLYAGDAFIEEQCLPAAPQGSRERVLFLEMLETFDLDRRHLICARYLGHFEHAFQLEDWIAKKGKRK